MNIKSGLLSFVKSRWFERGLCLVVILSLAGFFYYRLSAQRKQLENDSAQMAAYEENAKALLEKIDLSEKDVVRLNGEISDYKIKLEKQALDYEAKLKTELEAQKKEFNTREAQNAKSHLDIMYRLEEENEQLRRGLLDRYEMIVDGRIDPDVVALLIKHFNAMRNGDLKAYASTWGYDSWINESADDEWPKNMFMRDKDDGLYIKAIRGMDYWDYYYTEDYVNPEDLSGGFYLIEVGFEKNNRKDISYPVRVVGQDGKYYVHDYH